MSVITIQCRLVAEEDTYDGMMLGGNFYSGNHLKCQKLYWLMEG
ncbi:hypothetical protein [uncultured Nostoc sp.]